MEGIGAAANILAILDLSAKVATICFQYCTAVAKARSDIDRVYQQVIGLKTVLTHAVDLFGSPDSEPLHAYRDLSHHLEACDKTLTELQNELAPGKARKAMRRVGLRALKWPFTSKQTDSIIANLERYQQQIAFGLQIDQSKLLLHMNQKLESLTLVQESKKSPEPQSHFVVPYPSDPEFVKRPAIQKWVQEQFAGVRRRSALVGMGGFGKSQIAIQFAHESRSRSPETNVFWVDGSTRARFEESYRCLADTLQLPRFREPDVDTLALVRDSLQRRDIPPWLMILDNADDMDVFFPTTDAVSMASVLPKAEHGSILITSRSRKVAEKLTGTQNAILSISSMDGDEATELLRNKLLPELYTSDREALELVGALDHIPLAISQAAAYINQRAPRSSISLYLTKLRQGEEQKSKLLLHDGGNLWRHESSSNSIVLTWEITFEQIRQERPTAVKLLSLMSMFHHQDIPECMLCRYTETRVGETENTERSEDEFEDDLDILRQFSLVHVSSAPDSLGMHSLVQFCTQTWLSAFDDLTRWEDLFILLASEHFPDGDPDTYSDCERLLPHIQTILSKRPANREIALAWALLLLNVSYHLYELGDYAGAAVVAKRSKDARTDILGPDHYDVMTSTGSLGSIYRNQGRWEEAEELLLQVLENRKATCGPNSSEVLTSMNNLAMTYWNQGRVHEAEDLQLKAMDMCDADPELGSRSIVSCMANLATTYRMQGRWKEAEELNARAVAVCKEQVGSDHPSTLRVMNNLADIYKLQGRLEEAESLQSQVVKAHKEQLGPKHLSTLLSSNNLATIYRHLTRWDEAEQLHLEVLESSNAVFGTNHFDTLQITAELGLTYWYQKRWDEAEKLQLKVLACLDADFKTETQLRHTVMACLASTYASQMRWTEAEKLQVQIMETCMSEFGIDHPSTIVIVNNLAHTYSAQKRYDEAEKLQLSLIEPSRAMFGPDHPSTLTALCNLSRIYRDQGRLVEAEMTQLPVLDTLKEKLGAAHPSTVLATENLAAICKAQGRIEDAEKLKREIKSKSKSSDSQ